MGSFLTPLLHASEPQALRILDTSVALATAIEPAFDSASRRRGLLGRSRIEPGSALVIAPCSAIHTCFMRMSIDVVFASRHGVVLKTCRSLRPWRLAFAAGAYAVIELPAGTIDRTGVGRGNQLEVQPLSGPEQISGRL